MASVPHLDACISLPLENEVLEDIIEKARDWALMHGVCMRSRSSFSKDTLQFAPFVLLPSPFPRKEFQKAVSIQPILNELMHKVANDHEFLSETLKSTIEVDPFTRNLFKIYETVRQEGITQPIRLGLFRSDIMLETICTRNGVPSMCEPYCCWKQVEINTIASGFGWLGPSSSAVQRYVLQELGHGDKIKNLPKNSALEGLTDGLATAWKMYGDPNAVVMMVVEDVSYNICDQRFHEFHLRERHPEIRVVRRTLTQIAAWGQLGPKKELRVRGDAVAVVYFRAGYSPDHYPGQAAWDARLLLERSRAVKSPSIQHHLAGTKKVQQALARPLVVERFLAEPAKVDAVREIFTGLYSLDFDEFGEKAMRMALDSPEKYVLKPQREGGGNNVYGSEIRDALLAMKDSKERTAWILMERINPPSQKGYVVRPGLEGLPPLTDLVSELGIFGVIIGDGADIVVNQQVGHMLRTKHSCADEGGVAAGLGALDSPYLVDDVRGCP
ncbi:glutathione synthetase-like isoform X1 [Bacillus rossius redtenbacheri]|uniref:glutathione synthetase-like isoform X1 n=1 Tax=Bacillus rossius redtenbacheri TaxID=93214 RepID=UPI002FDCCD28